MVWFFLSGVAAVLVVGYTAVTTVAAHRLLQSRRRLSQVTPAEVGFTYEDIRFQARGEALNIAAWHIPAAGATRAVIIAHGVGGSRGREFTAHSLELVKYLIHSGFAVLMLDLRGHGNSDTARMTYGIRERHDLLGAVDWLLARGYTPGAIGVLGASMGGVAGMGAAGEEPAIGGLISDSACADFLAMIRIHFRRFSKLPLFFLPGTLVIGRLLTGEDLARLRPAELVRKIARRPVLIIHAKGDRLVPVDHARALAQAGEAELWITESASHLGSYAADRQAYIQRVIQFFDRVLARQPLSRAADDRRYTADLATLSVIHPGPRDEAARKEAQTLPVAAAKHRGLHMRWYMTPKGLRLRWEIASSLPDNDKDQIADEAEHAYSMVEEEV